jgi:hypothetical protein
MALRREKTPLVPPPKYQAGRGECSRNTRGSAIPISPETSCPEEDWSSSRGWVRTFFGAADQQVRGMRPLTVTFYGPERLCRYLHGATR